MKTIQIEIPEGKKAEWVNGVLTLVEEQPKDITERIKTFEDACKWCENNGHDDIVDEWERAYDVLYGCSAPDILAYLKLRIITCALNEGWEPTFEAGEERYTQRFVCTENKFKAVCSSVESSWVWHTSASALVFKSRVLAEYAASQFKDIYMDFCYKGKE